MKSERAENRGLREIGHDPEPQEKAAAAGIETGGRQRVAQFCALEVARGIGQMRGRRDVRRGEAQALFRLRRGMIDFEDSQALSASSR